MDVRRTILGLISLSMLGFALVTYLAVGLEDNAFLIGVCSKVGTVLLTIYLAWPVLEQSIDKLPAIANGIALGLLVFIAIKPRLLPIIVGGAVLFLVVHFGLRYVSNRLQNKR